MSETLEAVSNDMAALVAEAGASIVRVDGRRRLPATGIVWADGVVVTAHHVLTRDEEISVGLPTGDTVPAILAGRDPSTDVAVLRADLKGTAPAQWANPADLSVGHLVIAAGRPGYSVQAALGVVSALGESWRTPPGGLIDRYVQSDVVMYPGFSGGPLLTMSGAFAGLNTSALLRGMSMAVPAPTLTRVVGALLEHGHIKQGYLGVSAQPARLPDALADELGQDTGLLLAGIEPGGPADKGGLVLGDVIVALDGESVRTLDDLLASLTGDRAGKSVPVSVVRGGTLQTVDMTVGERD